MNYNESERLLKQLNKYLILSLFAFAFGLICVLIDVVKNGKSWDYVLADPKTGLFTVAFLVILIIPVIFSYFKYLYCVLKIIILSYTGKILNFEQWERNKHKFSLMLQDEIIDYYDDLRTIINDDAVFNRILKHNFLKGDKIDYLILTLGYPHFLIQRKLWLFYDKFYLFYFPYYEKRSFLNFFKLKFKFAFIIEYGSITKIKINGIEKI